MTRISRRAAFSLPALLAAPPAVRAQSRPIVLIVPFGAGTNVDAITRLVAPEIAQRIDRQIVIENVTGAGGTIATERAARAAPDGNTLLTGVESTINVAQLITPSTVRYDGLRDFVGIHMMATLPLLLIGRPDLPPTLPELVAAGRGRAQPFQFGTSGTGTSLHLFGELLALQTNMKLEHVPYRIGAQIQTDTMGGRLDLGVTTLTSGAPVVRDGRVRCYGVSSPQRHPFVPDIPTFSEQPETRGLSMEVWQALFAPARTDPAFVARVAQAAAAALATPELQQRIRDIGQTPSTMGPEPLAAFLREESARYQQLVRAANITPQ